MVAASLGPEAMLVAGRKYDKLEEGGGGAAHTASGSDGCVALSERSGNDDGDDNEDDDELQRSRKPNVRTRSFVRLLVLWAASVVCGGVTPGQAVFTPLFAEAGLFGYLCPASSLGGSGEGGISGGSSGRGMPCNQQYVRIGTILASLSGLICIGLLPSGILLDSKGARATGIVGALILAAGVLLLIASLSFDTEWLFVVAVVIIDGGSLMQNFGFFGLLFHLPGWQALILGLSQGCVQVAAGLPVAIRTFMEMTSVSLQPALLAFVAAICLAAAATAAAVPSQAEYFLQAQEVLGMPLPRQKATMTKMTEAVSQSWRIVHLSGWANFCVAGLTVSGTVACSIYITYCVSFGDALFQNKQDGKQLAVFFAQATAIAGVSAIPLAGIAVDVVGLQALSAAMALCLAIVTALCNQASWFPQEVACFAATFFNAATNLFMAKWVVLFAPPQRFGTVQGIVYLGVIITVIPCIILLSPLLESGPLFEKVLPTYSLAPVSVIGWAAVTWRLMYRPLPEIVLLEEDERDLALRFSTRRLADAGEVLGMSRHALLKALASQNVLEQRELFQTFVHDDAFRRYLDLARRRAEALPPCRPLQPEPVNQWLQDGAIVQDASGAEVGATCARAFLASGGERGEPIFEWVAEGWAPEMHSQFVKSMLTIQALAGERWGRALAVSSGSSSPRASGEEVEAVCVCFPPGGLEDGEAAPMGGDRWFYAVHKSGGCQPFMEVLRTAPAATARLATFASTLDEMSKHHRRQPPHWYVAMLGVLPGHRGKRRGKQLLDLVASWASKDHVPTYLECGPVNVPIYERCGFHVAWSETAECDGSEITLYGMIRPPE